MYIGGPQMNNLIYCLEVIGASSMSGTYENLVRNG